MRLFVQLILLFLVVNMSFSLDVYENQNSFNYTVTDIRKTDTLRYELNLKSDTSSNNSWIWTLNYSGMLDNQQSMINQTVTFDPIIDISPALPIKENTNIDVSVFKAYQISLPPLIGIDNLDKKILEPKIVLPIFNTTIDTKILNRPKKTTVKQTTIESNQSNSNEPTYKSQTNELSVDNSEVADCRYVVDGVTKFKTNKREIDVWVIKCECKELNDLGNINKATYYYNVDLGFVYFKIDLENDKIEIKLKE